MPVAAGGAPKYLLAVHHHCHATTCLAMEMWNNDTGALLCRQQVVYGGRRDRVRVRVRVRVRATVRV